VRKILYTDIGACNWPALLVDETTGSAELVIQFVDKNLKTFRFAGVGQLTETDPQEALMSAEKFLLGKEVV
jgi:hypothetical protein